jgi:hypothetical protein
MGAAVVGRGSEDVRDAAMHMQCLPLVGDDRLKASVRLEVFNGEIAVYRGGTFP